MTTGQLTSRALRSTLLLTSGLCLTLTMTACSQSQDSNQNSGETVEINNSAVEPVSGPAPNITVNASDPEELEGDVLTPLSGVAVTLPEGYLMLTPERLNSGLTQVTFAWGDDSESWSYLVLEGPGELEKSSVVALADAQRETLRTGGVAPADVVETTWNGASESATMVWNQATKLPYGTVTRSADAVGLWCADSDGNYYVATAYFPAGTATDSPEALVALSGLTLVHEDE